MLIGGRGMPSRWIRFGDRHILQGAPYRLYGRLAIDLAPADQGVEAIAKPQGACLRNPQAPFVFPVFSGRPTIKQRARH